MTIYVLGDYHGASLEAFIEEESPTEDDQIFSLGDFDTLESIREYLDLREEIGEENFVEVSGNHDIALYNGKKVVSRTSRTSKELVEDLEKDKRCRDYIESIIENPVQDFELGNLNGVLTHSGFTGLVRDPEISDSLEPFIYRLWEENHFHDNFEIMKEKEYDIMIRGHEHYTEHTFRHKETESISFYLPEPGDRYRIENSCRHIVTNGAWMDGKYLAIDPEEIEFSFQNISL